MPPVQSLLTGYESRREQSEAAEAPVHCVTVVVEVEGLCFLRGWARDEGRFVWKPGCASEWLWGACAMTPLQQGTHSSQSRAPQPYAALLGGDACLLSRASHTHPQPPTLHMHPVARRCPTAPVKTVL